MGYSLWKSSRQPWLPTEATASLVRLAGFGAAAVSWAVSWTSAISENADYDRETNLYCPTVYQGMIPWVR